jgi:hypothetical protein
MPHSPEPSWLLPFFAHAWRGRQDRPARRFWCEGRGLPRYGQSLVIGSLRALEVTSLACHVAQPVVRLDHAPAVSQLPAQRQAFLKQRFPRW